MANTQIDFNANCDLNDISSEPGGAVTADIRIVIRQGLTKALAHEGLLAATSALIGDAITLE